MKTRYYDDFCNLFETYCIFTFNGRITSSIPFDEIEIRKDNIQVDTRMERFCEILGHFFVFI